MKKFVISCFLLALAANISAQMSCATMQMLESWFLNHPELKAGYDKRRQQLAETDKQSYANGYKTIGSNAQAVNAAGNYTIPVVFHILHTGGSENISDMQVIDAVSILNRDFNKQNADTTDVVQPFKTLIGNPKIEFRLATKDPNGNCTNGIIRHWDVNTNWTKDFADYIYSWPSHRYLNVYVVRSMADAAGYTFLPGSGVPALADAIVILHTYVGSIGTGGAGTSRALTHEVGHWLDLPHTWGYSNNPGVQCGDDGITDTPVTKGFTSCNLSNAAICNPPVVENMQNYMDYAYCQRMFTIGQSIQMDMLINSPVNGRNNLWTSGNLAFTGVTTQGTGCATLLDINTFPSALVCPGQSLTAMSFTSNANPTSYAWSATGAGAVVQNPSSANTGITFSSPGTSTVVCTVTSPGGNVSKAMVVTVSNVTTYGSNYSESFEDNALPTGWTALNGSSSGQQWQLYNGAGSHGVQSVFVPGEQLAAGVTQVLEGPAYDFKNNPGALFTFKCVYARFNNSTKDVIKLQGSKNCGGSWTDIWVPSPASLANATGGTHQSPIVPFDEWALFSATTLPGFVPFMNESSVKLRFLFQADPTGPRYGNRIYLDEINFTAGVGVNEITKTTAFAIYPNPAENNFKIGFTLSDAGQVKYSVVSLTGATLLESNITDLAAGNHELEVNTGGVLASGIYFVNVELNGFTMSRKLLVR